MVTRSRHHLYEYHDCYPIPGRHAQCGIRKCISHRHHRAWVCSQAQPLPGRDRWSVLLVRFALACELAECGLGPGVVDLLRQVLWRGAKGCVVGDAVPAAVGRDGSGAAATTLPCAGLGAAHRVISSGLPSLTRGAERLSAPASISSRRSWWAWRMSLAIGPSADHISPAISRGASRVRPEPAGLAVARDPAVQDGGDVVGGSRASRSWRLASAQRISAVNTPKASDSTAASACSSVARE